MEFTKVKYPCGKLFIPSFYRLPRELMYHPDLCELSLGAKMLYTLMLDRLSLSVENKWYDERGNIYIYFTIYELCRNLNVSKPTLLRQLAELDEKTGLGLIRRKRQGLGKPDRIYVRLLPDMELMPPEPGTYYYPGQ